MVQVPPATFSTGTSTRSTLSRSFLASLVAFAAGLAAVRDHGKNCLPLEFLTIKSRSRTSAGVRSLSPPPFGCPAGSIQQRVARIAPPTGSAAILIDRVLFSLPVISVPRSPARTRPAALASMAPHPILYVGPRLGD